MYEIGNGFEFYGAGGYLRMHGTKLSDDNHGYAVLSGVGLRF